MTTSQIIEDINNLREEAKLRIRVICVETQINFDDIRPILDGKAALTRRISAKSEGMHELIDLYLEMGESKRKLLLLVHREMKVNVETAVSDSLGL